MSGGSPAWQRALMSIPSSTNLYSWINLLWSSHPPPLHPPLTEQAMWRCQRIPTWFHHMHPHQHSSTLSHQHLNTQLCANKLDKDPQKSIEDDVPQFNYTQPHQHPSTSLHLAHPRHKHTQLCNYMVRNYTQNASQKHFSCFLKDI